MGDERGTVYLQVVDSAVLLPCCHPCLEEAGVRITFLERSKLATLLPVSGTLANEQGQVCTVELAQAAFSCRERSSFLEHIK